MANTHTIRLLSDSNHDQLVVKSILGIVGHRANADWIYPEYSSVSSDVVIVDIDTALPDLAALKKQHQAKLVVVYGFTPYKLPLADFLLVKPVRAKDLLTLLSDLEGRLQQEIPASIDKLDISTVKSNTVSNSIQHKPDSSQRTIDKLLFLTKGYSAACLEVRFDGQVYCYVDNYRKRIFPNKTLRNYSPTGNMSYRVVDSIAQTSNFEAVTFTDFFYELTLLQPPVLLMSDLSVENLFSIKQWPNMGNSRHAKDMVRIAAYFSKQQATLIKAAHDLSLEVNDVIGFINAVHSQNLLIFAEVPPSQIIKKSSQSKDSLENNTSLPTKSSGIGGLFGRIRQRLGM